MGRRIENNLKLFQFFHNTQTSGVFSPELMQLSSLSISFSPTSLDQQPLPTIKH